MNQPKLKLDLKALANSELMGSLSKHLNTYEKKVKKLVNDFDLKSRDARHKGQLQLDKLANQFKKTRSDLEKRVTGLLHAEGQRLNQGVSELFNYLKSIAKNEKLEKKPLSSYKQQKVSKASGDVSSTRKSSPKKTRVKKSVAVPVVDTSLSSSGPGSIAG